MLLRCQAHSDTNVCVYQPCQEDPSTSSLGYSAYAAERSYLYASLRIAIGHVIEIRIVLLLCQRLICYRGPEAGVLAIVRDGKVIR